ncbi:MAG: aminotransferase class I/II-fold pyridoxal phosphate-dependent enzyme [Solirubrobacteraceae bacterium]
MHLPNKLTKKLKERINNGEYRSLKNYSEKNIDFFSNDYIGVVKHFNAFELEAISNYTKSGATGSRLISGNSTFYDATEEYLANFYKTEAALLFSSGYMANIGVLSALPQPDDLILYDEYVHASIRDGIRLNKAESMAFSHNNLEELADKLKTSCKNCYVVVESLYSMDGNFSFLKEINELCKIYNAYLIVDEAHTTGVYGKYGEGISAEMNLTKVIARIHTFGKGIGSHGAVIVGSIELKNYLVNFCRSFIYTTGLSDFMLNEIKTCHKIVENSHTNRKELKDIINYFNKKITESVYSNYFIQSTSPIQGILASKELLKEIETVLQNNSFNVKAIYSPSVPRGKERIRISLHSYNTQEEINIFFNLIDKVNL